MGDKTRSNDGTEIKSMPVSWSERIENQTSLMRSETSTQTTASSSTQTNSTKAEDTSLTHELLKK